MSLDEQPEGWAEQLICALYAMAWLTFYFVVVAVVVAGLTTYFYFAYWAMAST